MKCGKPSCCSLSLDSPLVLFDRVKRVEFLGIMLFFQKEIPKFPKIPNQVFEPLLMKEWVCLCFDTT